MIPVIVAERSQWRGGGWILRRFSSRRSERGQNLIEFALLTPFVLLIIFAIVSFGLAFSTRSNLQQSVREAARQVAVAGSLSSAQAIGAGNAPDRLTTSDITFCFPAGSSGSVGDEIRAEIRNGTGYDYALLSSGTNLFGVGSITVNIAPKATTRLERPLSPPASLPQCTS